MNITHIDPNLIQIFSEIIKINSLSQNEKPIADYLKNFLEEYSISYYEDKSQLFTKSNTGNIIAKINGGGDFILTSHMDTARSTENVKMVLREDRIISDGKTVLGVDNRAGIAILLTLLKNIKENNLDVKPFSIGFMVCEETTLDGSKNAEIDESIKSAFVFDSYLDAGHIVNQALGAVTFSYEIIGKASHSGISPEKGINSIKIASEIISQIEQGNISQNTTLNIGKIFGGSAVNVVPEKTSFEGEIRSDKKENIEMKIKEINNLVDSTIQKYKADYLEKIAWDFEPYYINENEDVYKRIKSAIINSGLNSIPSVSYGGSDANSFNARGIKALNLGIGAKNPHSNDEYILYKDFQKAYEIAINLVKR